MQTARKAAADLHEIIASLLVTRIREPDDKKEMQNFTG